MPPIHDLEPPTPSRARTAALALLRGYIALSALALAVDFVRVVRHS